MVGDGYDGWNMEQKGLSLMALAQHYGVPTRLLDWSRQAYIAAFFAGEDAYRNYEKLNAKGKMVVWSFFFPAFDKQTLYANSPYLLRGVTAPSATNANLKAQQGVFTLINSRYTKESEGDYVPMDIVLEEHATKVISSQPNSESWLLKCKLRKFTLPIAEACALLDLLAKLDITPSAIYPGYQSIVSDMQLQKIWD